MSMERRNTHALKTQTEPYYGHHIMPNCKNILRTSYNAKLPIE